VIVIQDLSGADTTTTEHKGEAEAADPYGVKEENNIGVYADSLEMTVLPSESDIKAFSNLYRRLL
jgi:aminoglycoside N3'-acetyltransferase